MREIKFRAWVKSENRMITDTQKFIPLIVTNKGVMKLQPQYKESYYEILPNDWFDFMESTGLNDKNGKEIYEGDIVECFSKRDEISFRAVVEFGNPNEKYDWGFQLRHIKGDKPNMEILLWVGAEEVEVYTEIIGNIYENPDLL